MMNRLFGIVLSLCTVVVFASCLKNDAEDVVYYDDTAITGFSIGTLKRTVTTKSSDGKDSVVYTTVDGSAYKFYIDQVQKRIYNTDSLPKGTDPTKVVCTVTTKNSGVVVLQFKNKAGEDSLAVYSSTDSINIATPLTVRVYSNRGTDFRAYTVTLNVHNEDGTEMRWQHFEDSNIGAVTGKKLVSLGQDVYLFGSDGRGTVAYKVADNTFTPITTTLGTEAYKHIVSDGTKLYALDNGVLKSSENAATWQTVAQRVPVNNLLGATHGGLYALSDDGIYCSTDGGSTWNKEELDEASALLPATDANFVAKQHRVVPNLYKLIIAGYAADGTPQVWGKTENQKDMSKSEGWSRYVTDSRNEYVLPVWDNLHIAYYDGKMIALGSDFKSFYSSEDEGLTWFKDTLYSLPTEFGFSSSAFTMTVSADNIIYVIKDGESKMWKGRLARTAWKTDNTGFEGSTSNQ